MSKPNVAIVFGGASPENRESLRAAQILYKHTIKGVLDQRYDFSYFYLTPHNRWVTEAVSKQIVQGECKKYDPRFPTDSRRLLQLKGADVIYNTMMGTSGENGNIMGLADLLNIPIIGCGIKASALALDKHLCKILAGTLDIETVDYIYANKYDDPENLVRNIEKHIGFPCFVKPNNLGTCAYVFKANNKEHFLQEWKRVTRKNDLSDTYLIEKYIDNIEVRVFVHEDAKGRLQTNDRYVTTLKPDALKKGGALFDHLDNRLSRETRQRICKNAKKIFRLFGMKDYCRIDFFVENGSQRIYFNEANTQPFLSSHNIKLMEEDGYSYATFFHTMIKRNLK